jgi:mono/diheme cytochrome c family protein
MRRMLIALLAVGSAITSAACTKPKTFTEKITLHAKVDKDGNDLPNSAEVLDPHQLNNGYEAYMLYCYGCHGEKGDGLGPAAAWMRPPPRNFNRGLFKFPGTEFGQLPTDSALDRTIRRGLHGTPMLAWDIPARERQALIGYLKSLSPRWIEEGVKPDIEIAPDPWKGKEKAEAIALGRTVYHIAQGGAGCSGCHASYLTKNEIYELSKQVTPDSPVTEFSAEPSRTLLKESEYPVDQVIGVGRRRCELATAKNIDASVLTVAVNNADVPRYEGLVEAAKADTSHDAKASHMKVTAWMKANKVFTAKLAEKVKEDPQTVKSGWDYDPATGWVFIFGEACDQVKSDEVYYSPSVVIAKNHQLLPPDFLFHKVKTAYPVGTQINEGDHRYVPYTEEMQREELYRTIGVGIGGAAMPGWKGVLEEDKLWALVYYVQSLVELNGSSAGIALRSKLDTQPAFQAPGTPAPVEGTATP